MDPVLTVVLRTSLGLLFAAAFVHKLRDLPRFVAIVDDYRLVPGALIRPVALAVPVAECATAIAMLAGASFAPIAALAAIAAYSIAIGINLARGRRDIDCGCGGPGGQRIGPGLLVRNAGLALVALLLFVPSTERAIGFVDIATMIAAVAFVVLAGSAVARLASLPESSSIRERIPT